MSTTVIFYEKPGCGNNARQKLWLEAAGHTVIGRNLLTEKWTEARLRPFFGNLPVADWFNRAAPRIKSGEVQPQKHDEAGALAMMVVEPLLIRRPLMEIFGSCICGFDPPVIDAWIGLTPVTLKKLEGRDSEACLHSVNDSRCEGGAR